MKSNFYFDHDYNARNDLKVLQLRSKEKLAGYGLFWMIVEVMAEQDGYIKREALAGLSIGLNMPLKKLTEFIDYCIKIELFHEDKNGIFSKRIIQHLKYRQSLSDAGRRGGRGNKREDKATVKPPFSQAEATPEAVKESKGKEISFLEQKTFWDGKEGEFDYIVKYFPKLLNMKEPLTYKEHKRLTDRYGQEETYKLYGKMQNNRRLVQNNESAYLTAISWMDNVKLTTNAKAK